MTLKYTPLTGSSYGLVSISGSTVDELADFTALQTAFAGTTNPTGDGGYNHTAGASGCPAKSANWDVDTDALPAIPSGAKAYMTKGAGTGPGLTGAGSQNAGGASSGTATAGSGTVTATASAGSSSTSASSTSTHTGAASALRPTEGSLPWAMGAVLGVSVLFGAALL